jgi:hypothetical protein
MPSDVGEPDRHREPIPIQDRQTLLVDSIPEAAGPIPTFPEAKETIDLSR